MVGLFLGWWGNRHKLSHQRRAAWLGAVAFVGFGISDYVEIPTLGFLPGWLWAWKILCGATLAKAWYDWKGIDRTKRVDRQTVLFLLLFLAALTVALQQILIDR